MEIDLSSESAAALSPGPRDRIVQRLSQLGIPWDTSLQEEYNFITFAKCHKWLIRDLVFAVLPDEDEEADGDGFRESMVWLRWLMFEQEPKLALEQLAEVSSGQRGVCGAVWGNNDIAYRCRTCEHDPTCAICVPCFENGNHKDHDYSVIYTGGGCCDCGDITAWKRDGFCLKHKGAEQIQPLPKHLADSLGPVLDLLLNYWKDMLSKLVFDDSPTNIQIFIDELTSAVVEMLLDFCKHHESLLSFISVRVYSSAGLLEILMMAEKFISGSIVGKLHELLLKLLGEPTFKFEFAKAFVLYYPTVVSAAIAEASDAVFKKYPLLSTFSVQILTVPTLAPRLVEEMNLLGILFQCLETIFSSCAGEDGRLQVAKWANLYETSFRVVEDIRFVMSHSAVPKYLCHHKQEFVRTWLNLLGFVQGMNPQKRELGSHIDEENENVHLPFVLCHSISNILSLLVAGAFSVDPLYDNNKEGIFKTHKLDHEDQCGLRCAKDGKLSQEGSVSFTFGKTAEGHETKAAGSFPLPSSSLWLIYECLRSIENWLAVNNALSPLGPLYSKASDGSSNNFFTLRKTLFRFRRGTYSFSSSTSPESLECRNSLGQPVPSNSDGNTLETDKTCELEGLRILNSCTWPDIKFDVGSQEISVHFPLHQFLAMLFRRALKECYGENVKSSDSSAVLPSGRNSDFFERILNGCHRYSFSAYLMEHPLRIKVFCAQVHSRMWRRNGDTPIIFSECYRSVRWSEQGQELDLFLLQVCAALASPDLFVVRILERFGLSSYLSLDLGHASEHEPVLVAEMLTLLIQIVKERRFCGLTTEQCLLRELVYKLSVGDATRSQLVKSLPRDLSKADELQEVLDRVAEYSRPSGMTQGTYKLLTSLWKELDLYHPRWNLRDQQTAVERYSHFCNVSALTTQLPKWTKIYHPLSGIAKIATCKSLLQIIRAVLFYAVFTDKSAAPRAPDGVLLTALHLLALALDVCRSHKESGDLICYDGDSIPILAFATEEIFMSEYGEHSLLSLLFSLLRIHEKENAKSLVDSADLSTLILSLIRTFTDLEPACTEKLQTLAPQLVCQFLGSTLTDNPGTLGSKCETEMRKAKARERQAAILEKMRNQQSKFLENFSSKDAQMDDIQFDTGSGGLDDTVEPNIICSLCHDHNSGSPVSFLVLLQKSRLPSFVDQGQPLWFQVNSSPEEHVRHDTVMSNESSPGSVSDGPELITVQLEDWVQSAVNDFASMGQPAEINAFMDFIKARFPSVKNFILSCKSNSTTERLEPPTERFEEHAYLLARESTCSSTGNTSTTESSKMIDACSEPLLLGKYIASLPEQQQTTQSASKASHHSNKRIKFESRLHPDYDNLGPSGNDGGIYISSCGHAVHQECLDRYLSSLRERHIRRIVFEGGHIVDPAQGEFLCPVCRGLANSVLPTLPGKMRKVPHLPTVRTDAGDFSTPSEADCSLHLEAGLSFIERTANIVSRRENLNALPLENIRMENLEPIIHLLCGMYYPGQDKITETGRVSNAVILWHTLKYTLTATEIAARSRKRSLCPTYDLGALLKELNSSTGFILSLLLDVIQNARTSYQTVLIRFHAIQLFAKSLCRGTYSDELHGNCSQRKGLLYILENSEIPLQYPDIQLWRLASEPVVAHDSFSSFMWILFCLPWPVLSCRESYFALVHVFYVVSMTQAIIIFHKRSQGIDIGEGLHDSMITDVFQVIGEHPEVGRYFESYFLNPAYDIFDAISSLVFPFLRRCALLWKLINGSSITPFNFGSSYGDEYLYTDDDVNYESNSVDELLQAAKLKKYFKIPPERFIVNDERSRSRALMWLSHLCAVLEPEKCRRVLRCTPAMPFRLMLLPYLYQDLLQRYIKKSCPECGGVKEEPALCLLCGKLCSPNWRPCCRESSCQTHAAACGAGMGVFLLIKRTTVLLQRSARQAHWPSPYLDAFGEEDSEMRRGKPLYLSEERYAALTHMVSSHGVDRSSEVLRQTTIGSFFIF